MNGLPTDIDLSPIVGRQLAQLCFGAWIVAMHFDQDVKIVVEDAILIRLPQDATKRIVDFRKFASMLCGLIGRSVVEVGRTPSGGLLLLWSDGSHVEFTVEDQGYEAFQLHFGGTIYVA